MNHQSRCPAQAIKLLFRGGPFDFDGGGGGGGGGGVAGFLGC